MNNADSSQPNGFEPELGGIWRQRGVFVDENICIGCQNCVHVATNTFYVEPEYGRARVFNQDGDDEELIEEAIDTCPVNCIHWLDYTELSEAEESRKHQVIQSLAIPPELRRSRIVRSDKQKNS
ncbi:MAG: ferredoxin [Cyanobacteria bacterium P01_C01_bin.72]